MGLEKGKIETASEMKAEGIKLSVIQKVIKLSLEEFKEIGVA